MAGIIAIYGLVVSVIIGVGMKGPEETSNPYTPYNGIVLSYKLLNHCLFDYEGTEI